MEVTALPRDRTDFSGLWRGNGKFQTVDFVYSGEKVLHGKLDGLAKGRVKSAKFKPGGVLTKTSRIVFKTNNGEFVLKLKLKRAK